MSLTPAQIDLIVNTGVFLAVVVVVSWASSR